MYRRYVALRLFCAALMVLATASAVWAQTAEETEKKEPAAKTEPAATTHSAATMQRAICKPAKSTDEFNTLEDLFAAQGSLALEALIGPQAPPRTGAQNPAEATVVWRIVEPD